MLECSRKAPGCVVSPVYRHADPGMGPLLYCYACLPTELRSREHQLVYRDALPRALATAPDDDSFVSMLPPSTVAGLAVHRLGVDDRAPLARTSGNQPAQPVPHDALPTRPMPPPYTPVRPPLPVPPKKRTAKK